jgi:hypothetical protein
MSSRKYIMTWWHAWRHDPVPYRKQICIDPSLVGLERVYWSSESVATWYGTGVTVRKEFELLSLEMMLCSHLW